jgi:hypothetical protein
MKRAIRRQLRIWYSDISGYLSKLRTFHRTALGIILAIVIIFVARKYWLDPLRAEVAEQESKYEKSEPPNPLPTIESDEEITLANEQIISREKSAETKKREMETVTASRPKITQQNRESVLSELAAIISKNKLVLVLAGNSETDTIAATQKTTKPAARKNTDNKATPNTNKTPPKTNTKNQPQKNEPEPPKKQDNEPPLKYEEYTYNIEGDFGDIFNFLKQIETFKYPIKITKFYLGSDQPATNNLYTTTKREKLQLKFNLILYFHN